MDRLAANIDVIWVAYHQAIADATASATWWAIATIVALLAVGLLTTMLGGKRSRLVNGLMTVAAIAAVSGLDFARCDAIRTAGYLAGHGHGDSARTVQLVCSVVRFQIKGGQGFGMTGVERHKVRQACGALPVDQDGIDV